jgi:NADH-quinone oxidoreductase subunit K
MGETLLFHAFSGLAIVASALVVGQRNPMYSVLLLVASFAMISGLYVQLDAPFIAVIQIIVYAGALMVLFLYVVMLLNEPREDAADWDRVHPLRGSGTARFGAGLALVLVLQLAWALLRTSQFRSGHWPDVVPRLRVRIRGHVRADSGGACRRGVPRASRGRAVIPLSHYLIVSAVLFAIGAAGVFMRRNVITILLSIEIMLNAVNLTFVAFGRHLGTVDGQIIVIFVITVAAAEAAVGLALVVALFRHRESLNPDAFTALKW